MEAKIFCLNCYQIKSYWLIEIEFFCLHSLTYRNQLDVAPIKNLLFLAVLKLDVNDSFGYNKEIERMGKSLPVI